MAVTIDCNMVITIPKADLTPLGGTDYELDVDAFRLELKALEDNEDHITCPDTHRHTAPVTVGGVTLARVVEIINGYSITFEDGQYSVTLTGANNNIADVMNLNQVSLRSNNTAGLVQVVSGSGVTEQDKDDIVEGVRDVMDTDTYTEIGQGAPPSTTTIADMLRYMYKAWRNQADMSEDTYQLYNDAGDTVDHEASVSVASGVTTRGKVGSGA